MAISISGTHQQLKRKRAGTRSDIMRGGLRITGRQSSIFAPKKCNLDIAPHTLPRQSACVPAVRDGLPTAHCQAGLSGFNGRTAAKALASSQARSLRSTLRSISVRRSTREKSHE
jgi:hypothetical protein